MNLIDVTKKFATPEACNDFLESVRWPNGAECLHCGSKKVTKYVKQASLRTIKDPATKKPIIDEETGEIKTRPVPARILYNCRECKKQFSVTDGTIFHDTHLDLERWFMAVALMVNAKKGLSALQMKRDLRIAYKTAWYLNHRIREAMGGSAPEVFEGTVEADATYVGGKYDKRRKREPWQKPAVFGIIQRKTAETCSKVHAEPILTESRPVVQGIIEKRVSSKARIFTDEARAYRYLEKGEREYAIVAHTLGEYVRGDVHSNSIENFWSLFKRGLIGSFHQISVKHLSRYLAEFTYRFNNRDEENLWALVIAALLSGIPLPYKALIARPETENPQNLDTDIPF